MKNDSVLPQLSQSYRSLADLVFENLRDAVFEGCIESGQWFRQETLAHFFQI